MKKRYSHRIDKSYWLSKPISKTLQKSIITLLLLFSIGFANGQTFVVDGLKYTVTTATEVSVNKDGTCPTGALTIPSLVTDPNSSIEYTVRAIENNAFQDCSALTNITLPNSLTSIGNFAFFGCSGLNNLTLPNSITSIGIQAFRDCSALTNVTLPNSITSIASQTFQDCSALTNITLPNSLISIGETAFFGCNELSSITLPNSLTSIGTSAFYQCSALSSLSLPNSLTSIETSAFAYCSALTNITLPNSLATIGNFAFFECNGLISIDLPISLTSIGTSAFANCSALTEVTVAWQMPITINSGVFLGLTLSGITLKVPEGEITTYEAASVWTDFSPISAVHNLTKTACGNFEFGDSTYTVSGIYNDTITTTENNDSISRLNLTILDLPDAPDLTVSGSTISAFVSDSLSYQWINCSNNTVVAGQTSSTFSPTESGRYGAILSNETCSDTTACIEFTLTSVVSNDLPKVVLYPNPTSSNITIRVEQGFNMEITNVLGEIVLKQELVNTETTLETSRLNKGIYFINLYSQKGNQTLRFVKE